MQLIRIGKIGEKEGFCVLSQVFGGFRGDDSWCVTVYRRDPRAISGIREVTGKDYLSSNDNKTFEKFFRMVEGESLWHKNYRCAAKIAQDLGWC